MIGVALIVMSIVGFFTCKKRIAFWDGHIEKFKKTLEELAQLESKPGSDLEIIRRTRKSAQNSINDLKKYNKILKIFMYTCIVMIVLGIFCTGLEVISYQKEDKITKKEKEWLENNLGDGKYEEIQDAIDDYKNK